MTRQLFFLALASLVQPAFAQVSQTADKLKAAASNPKAPVQGAVIPADPPSQWTLTAGVQWRQIGEATLHTRSQSGGFALPGLSGAATGGGGSGSGQYVDGYVLPDSTGSGSTWNWGFDNPSQLQGSQLSLTSSSGAAVGSLANTGGTHREDLSAAGPFIELESPAVLQRRHLKLSFTLGYSYAEDDAQAGYLSQLAVQQSSFVDIYDISPALPLSGSTYQGTFSGPGPVISRTPVSHTQAPGLNDTFAGSLGQSFDLHLHTVSIGPRVAWEYQRLRVTGSLGLALNIADWNSTVTESFTDSSGTRLGRWQVRHSSTDVLPGFYLQVGPQIRLTNRLLLVAQGRYDWSESLHGQVGRSDVHVDLGGWTAMVGLSLRF